MPRSADSVNAIPLLSVNENEELKRTLFSQIIMWAHSLEPSGYPAVFASLSEEISRPLNEYAFGDIPQLAKTIDAALAWDQSHSNALTPRKISI
jgi:hypothetical protein